MASSEFDDIIAQAKQLGQLFANVYKEITGEELEVESAIRHYPLVALGLAAGAGALGGWWLARRGQPQLPPPPPQKKNRPLGVLEQFLPGSADRVREVLPEVLSAEAGAAAKEWVDSSLQPRLKKSLDKAVGNVSEGKWGKLFRQQLQQLEPEDDQEQGPRP